MDHAAKSAVGMVSAMVATPPKPETKPEPKVRVDCHDTRASMAGSTAPVASSRYASASDTAPWNSTVGTPCSAESQSWYTSCCAFSGRDREI